MEGVAHAISRHVVAIISMEDAAIGSGVVVRLNERVFILSAWHVFFLENEDRARVPVDLRKVGYVFRPETLPPAVDPLKLSSGVSTKANVYSLPIINVIEFANDDFIVLELDATSPARFNFMPFDLSGRLLDPRSGALVNFTGYPLDLTGG